LAEKAYKAIKADPVDGSPETLHEVARVINPTLARHYDVAERVAMGRHAHPTVYNLYQQNEFGSALYKEVATQFPDNSKVHKTLREEAIKTANNFERYKRNAELLYNNGLPITDPDIGAGAPVLVGGYTLQGQPVVTAHNNTTGESLIFVGDEQVAAIDNTVRAVVASREKSSSVSATDKKHDSAAGSNGKMDCSSPEGDGFFEWLEGSYPQLAAVLYSLPYGASFLLQLLYITVRRLDEKGVFDPLFHRINTLR
jgi:hypothetical protein